MERAFELLHQFVDPVIVQRGTHAQRARADDEAGNGAPPAQMQRRPQEFVDDLLERSAGPPNLGFERRRYVLF